MGSGHVRAVDDPVRVNDDYFADNSGTYTVTLTRFRR